MATKKIRKVLKIRAYASGECHETWATHLHSRGCGRVPTRSVLLSAWGGRGPFTKWLGSFPPASEREARMDDPMVRSRLGRTDRNATWGLSIPSEGPLLHF